MKTWDESSAEDGIGAPLCATCKTVLDEAPVVVWVVDAAGECRFISDHWTRLTGQPVAEALGTGWMSRVAPEDRSRVAGFQKDLLEGRTTGSFEYQLLTADGSRRWADVRSVPMSAPDGRAGGFVGTLVDATDRKRQEHALEYARLIIDRSPVVLYRALADDAFSITYISENVTHFGYTPEDFLSGRVHFPHYVLPEDQPLVLAVADRLRRGDADHFDGEYRVVDAAGTARWVHDHTIVERDEDGRVTAWLGTLSDITSSREAAELRGQLASIVESSQDAIVGLDLDGIITSWNGGATRLSGYEAGRMLGRAIGDPVVRRRADEIAPLIARIKAGETVAAFETAWRRADGTMVEILLGLSPIRDEEGSLTGISLIAREITQIKEAERALRRSFEATIQAIAGLIEMRDPYTAGHENRVSMLAVAIARSLGLSRASIEGLSFAARVHDIGKIRIPAEILNKPSPLDPLEYELIKLHVEAGYEILKQIEFPWPVADIVRQHHERLDGSGYPRKLTGEAILPEAKILAVADVVESMTTDRPYRPRLGLDRALAEIEHGRGTRYDPAAVDACIALCHQGGLDFLKARLPDDHATPDLR